ncbi:MAG: alpha/beta hydrolase [Alphaproteobacteria bacterium]
MAVTVYFATNRNPIGKPPTDFGPKLSSHEGLDLRFGRADVDLVFEPGGGADEDASTIEIKVAKEQLTSRARAPTSDNFVFGSNEVFDHLRRKMVKHTRDSIIYIHGFANSFKSSIVRAAEHKQQLGDGANLAVFSWQSDGEVFLYTPYERDRTDARASGQAMAKAIRTLARYLHAITSDDERREIRRSLLRGEDVPIGPCEQKIHLLAHSMGNYAFRHGVVALRDDFRGKEVKLFDKVFLMAADADDDVLSEPDKMAFLPQISEKISVYHTPRDRALWVSETTKGNRERLGSDGPFNNRALPDKIEAIDVSAVLGHDSDQTNHQYYRLNPAVLADMRAVFADGPTPWRDYDAHGRRFRLVDRG